MLWIRRGVPSQFEGRARSNGTDKFSGGSMLRRTVLAGPDGASGPTWDVVVGNG
jgi:hypothetical protein